MNMKRIIMYMLHHLFPQKKNSVVFVSFSGTTYSDNPKAISKALGTQFPHIQQYWVFADPATKKLIVDPSIVLLKKWNMKSVLALARACVWVFNDTLPVWAWKGKNQYFIQTWHGDRGFKKILYDFSEREGLPLLQEQFACDLAVAGSDFGESFFRTAFRYTGDVSKSGCPRNDCLVTPTLKHIENVKQSLGLDLGFKYVLYAPTLRNKKGQKREAQPVQSIDFLGVLDTLERTYCGSWKMLVRSHVKVPGLVGIPQTERILDVTRVEDMADLLLASDVLITDYSSSAGDFALLNRPIILYQEDRKAFTEQERTLYFDLETSPFWIASDQTSLETILADLPNRDTTKNCEAILRLYGTCETGHSSADIAYRIAAYCSR